MRRRRTKNSLIDFDCGFAVRQLLNCVDCWTPKNVSIWPCRYNLQPDAAGEVIERPAISH